MEISIYAVEIRGEGNYLLEMQVAEGVLDIRAL